VFKTNRYTDVFHLYIAIIIIGFFVIGSVPALIGVNINFLTEAYRFLILLISLLILLYIFIFKNSSSNFNLYLFYLFWIIYSLRILYDLLFSKIIFSGDYSKLFYFQYAFGVVFIPTFCVILISKNFKLDYKYILKIVFSILLFTLLFIVYKRFTNIEIIDRSSQILSIGIIEFGHYGCTLILLAIYRIVEEKSSIFKVLLFLFAIIVGFSAIIISASKGPLLALLVSLLLFFKFRFKVKAFVFAQTLLGLILYFFGFYLIELMSDLFDSNFLLRIFYTIDEAKDEARNSLLTAALDDFINSPIFGSSMFIQKSGFEGSYPHNLIVESFMATGIFGGTIFVVLVLTTCIKALKAITNKMNHSWISLVFFQYLIFGMVSSNLYSLDLFWLSLGVILAIKPHSNKLI
jgi:hypothetical protein